VKREWGMGNGRAPWLKGMDLRITEPLHGQARSPVFPHSRFNTPASPFPPLPTTLKLLKSEA